MAIITIIGSGMMGSALSWPLTDAGHEVRLVGTHLDTEIIRQVKATGYHPTLMRPVPQGVSGYYIEEVETALSGAELVVGGISSFGVDWFSQVLNRVLKPGIPVLSVTKGLVGGPQGDLQTFPERLEQNLPAHLQGKTTLNAIGGPCTSHELAARRQTAVVFCGKDPSVLRQLKAWFSTPYYHVNISTDVTGVEVCAALKNAYALGVSLAVGMMERDGLDGVAWSYNPQAALFAQGCLEMRRMLRFLGGSPDLASWLPGAGDLYVTIFGGRTVKLGKLLGQDVPFAKAREMLAGVTLESVEITSRVAAALPKLEARGLLRRADFPLLMHVDGIINRNEPVNIPWEQFGE
jgi:glycerol-3-phosphate dehydrogenase (NAD(P)+)